MFQRVAILVIIASFSFALQAQTLDPIEQQNIRIFEQVSKLVVHVNNIQQVRSRIVNVEDQTVGTGSGILWDDKGHVITNFHVIVGAKAISVTLANGKTATAEVVGIEPRKDIAVLKIDSKVLNGQKNAKLLIADSNELQVGQRAIAIGNPFGLDRAMSVGVVSALNRRIDSIGGVSIRDMIQTDASINPGNSGGPLFNSSGELIGMNTSLLSKDGTSAGIGFAVPSKVIQRIVPQLIENGRVKQIGIGVRLLPPSVTKHWDLSGIAIAAVLPKSPAAEAGLRPAQRDTRGKIWLGDVILEIDGQAIKDYDDLYNALDKKQIGQQVKIKVLRDEKELTVKLDTINLSKLKNK